MAVGAFEFVNHLSAASIDAVGYGEAWSDVVSQEVPTISLLAQHGAELAKAFALFSAWSELTDPDSVELTFVFKNDGGYVLAISPEYSRLERRCLGFDRTLRSAVIAATWFKPMNSTHPMLLRFRKYCSGSIAPFLFRGDTYSGPRDVLSASRPLAVQPLPNAPPLLKFVVGFADEDEAIPDTIPWAALHLDTRPRRKSQPPPRKLEPDEITRQRLKALMCHFPVTLERIRRSSGTRALISQLGSEDVRAWQVEQALCNLVLSGEMGLGAHYGGLSDRKVQTRVLDALKSRYETATGDELRPFTVGEVRTQLRADGNALLRQFGKKRVSTVAELQASLLAISALDAPAAIRD